jgi:hypothetical protein
MTEPTHAVEKQRVGVLAEEYRSKGYEVIIEPSSDQLPEFLSGYRPDLLVRKGNEAVIVEVKSRSSLTQNSEIRDLARLVHGAPGWNFELVVIGEEGRVNTPEEAVPLAREEILQRLQESERLLDAGAVEAAVLVAWSASEAAVRLLATEEGLALDRPTAMFVIKQAVMNGVILREDYNFFERAMKYRNALAHGYKVPNLDPMLVKDLIGTTKHILEDQPAA